MSITPRTRKILWVKAAGRCSICHEQLATEGTEEDDPSVFGEECHIVARSPGGARANDIPDIDGYDNLILLCRKHHKQVDDQRSHFTVRRLTEIKRDHEQREASREAPIRLISDPTRPAPKLLRVCMTGEALWQSVNGAHSFWPSWPDRLNDQQSDAVDELLDLLCDYLDLATELSYKEGRQAARELGEYVKRLDALGVVVGIRDRQMLLVGGNGEPSSWRGFDIQFQRAREVQLADEHGAPLASRREATKAR